MKHVYLRDLEVARIGLGAMGMSHAYTGAGSDDTESIRTIHHAVELTAEQIAKLENPTPTSGAQNNEQQMQMIGR